MDDLLDRPLGEDEGLGDRRVVLALGHLGEDLRSRGVSSLSGDSSLLAFSATSASTTFGSKTEPPSATAWIAATSWSRSLTRSFRR